MNILKAFLNLSRRVALGSLLGSLAVASLAGCSAAVAPKAAASPQTSVDRGPVDGRPLLIMDSAKAVAMGAGPLVVVNADVASDGDRVGGFVELSSDDCTLAFARGSDGVGDVDLFAYEDDGAPYATDEAPAKDATVILCPEAPMRVYVAARVVSGTGFVSVGVQNVPRAQAARVAKALNARGQPGQESGRLSSWPGLESKVSRHRADLGSHWEDVRRVAAPTDSRAVTTVTAKIGASRCIDVLITPSDEVGSLDVSVSDEDGRIVARAHQSGRDRTLLLCSDDPMEVSLLLRARASQGLVAVVIAQSEAGAEAELIGATQIHRLTETRDLSEARAGLSKIIDGSGYDPAKTIATGKAKVGSRVSMPIVLPNGCSRIDVVGGKPLVSLAVELWDEAGALLGQSHGASNAAVFHCGAAQKARVDVEAMARPGPFAVEMRRDHSAPAALVDAPEAASRLLDRMNLPGAPVDASAAGGTTRLQLKPNVQHRSTVSLSSGECADVYASTGSGGSGLELRLKNRKSELEALRRAPYVLSERVCAGDEETTFDVELRLLRGPATVLFLVRKTAPPSE